MAYRTPEGYTRVWTYLPEALVGALRRRAAEHHRRLAQELVVALEEYIGRQGQRKGTAMREHDTAGVTCWCGPRVERLDGTVVEGELLQAVIEAALVTRAGSLEDRQRYISSYVIIHREER